VSEVSVTGQVYERNSPQPRPPADPHQRRPAQLPSIARRPHRPPGRRASQPEQPAPPPAGLAAAPPTCCDQAAYPRIGFVSSIRNSGPRSARFRPPRPRYRSREFPKQPRMTTPDACTSRRPQRPRSPSVPKTISRLWLPGGRRPGLAAPQRSTQTSSFDCVEARRQDCPHHGIVIATSVFRSGKR
jgi:hypothetical protein